MLRDFERIQRVAIYMRVSTHRQELEETMETQRVWLEKYCRQIGWEIVAVYADEDCKSSVPFERRADGGRLLREAAGRRFDAVLVYRLDRVSRYRKVFYDAADALAHHELGFFSMHERFETATPMGRLSLAMLIAFAEYERDSIHQRTTEGMVRTAGMNGHMGGPTPYGYVVVGHKPRFLKPDDSPVPGLPEWSEMKVVQYMFYLAGEQDWSTARIADELNNLGIPTAVNMPSDARELEGSKSRPHWNGRETTNTWQPPRVAWILRQSVYKGVRHYNKHRVVEPDPLKDGEFLPNGKKRRLEKTPDRAVEQEVPALVSPELWEKARANVSRRSLYSPRNSKTPYLLRGLIRCGSCGYTYHGWRSKGWPDKKEPGKRVREGAVYYGCCGRMQPGRLYAQGKERCRMPSLPADLLEADLWGQVVHHLYQADQTVERVREQREQAEQNTFDLVTIRDGICRERERIQSQERNLVEAVAEGTLTKAQVTEKMSEIGAQLKSIAARITEIDLEIASLENEDKRLAELEAYIHEYRARLSEEMSWEERRFLIEQVVTGITVELTEEKQVRVRYRFCFDPVENCKARRTSLRAR